MQAPGRCCRPPARFREAYVVTESLKSEFGFYPVADGTNDVYRTGSVHRASGTCRHGLHELTILLADVASSLGSLDIGFGEIAR